ncbi:MAG: hypothetical protein CM15mP12_6990 [Gammaproteobacteria bacterium]|nr:MAG: hypothetical protein CM15mP12_6990 [Gammaproteobacteria bacterium]
MPPFTGSRCSECTDLHPVKTFIPFFSFTPNLIVCVLLQDLICFASPGSTPVFQQHHQTFLRHFLKIDYLHPFFP